MLKADVRVFRSLQAGRGVAALMVVLYHCAGIFSLTKYWHYTGRNWFCYGSSGVEYFFVLSGIVILHAHWKDLNQPRALREYAWKRIRRIYPIYWFVLFLVLPFYFIMPSFGNGFERNFGTIAEAAVLLPIVDTNTILPIAWTLLHEIMFYLVFATLILNTTFGVPVLCCWFAASIAAIFLPVSSPVLAAYLSPYHLFFGLGLAALVYVRRSRSRGSALAAVGLLGFLTCCGVQLVLQLESVGLVFLYAFFAALLSAGLMLREQHKQLGIPPSLVLLGDASYSLYLVHYAVLSAAAKLVYPMWLSHPMPLAVPFVLLVVIAVAAGILVHLCVERPLLKWLPKKISRAAGPGSDVTRKATLTS